jgi:hypothetical protein
VLLVLLAWILPRTQILTIEFFPPARIKKAQEDLKKQPSFDEEKVGLKKKLLKAGKERIGYAQDYVVCLRST